MNRQQCSMAHTPQWQKRCAAGPVDITARPAYDEKCKKTNAQKHVLFTIIRWQKKVLFPGCAAACNRLFTTIKALLLWWALCAAQGRVHYNIILQKCGVCKQQKRPHRCKRGFGSMPKIGMRILKSALAVLLCFLIDLLRGAGTPFYSAIAALLCMQPTRDGSLKTGLNRVKGTVLGAAFGLVVLLAERQWLPQGADLLRFLLISLALIPLLYLTALLQMPTASYITCVVFLSITVSHGEDVTPWLFALNRMVDTLLGIGVSLGLNSLALPQRRRGLLMVSGVDGVLLGPGGKLTPTARVQLCRLLERGALVSVSSYRTPATLLPLLQGVPFALPLITMNGAALYDPRTHQYLDCSPLPVQASAQLNELLQQSGESVFCNCLQHEHLHIYWAHASGPAVQLRQALAGLPHHSCIEGPLPGGEQALSFFVLAPAKKMSRLLQQLDAVPCRGQFTLTQHPDLEHPGYEKLEITSAQADTGTALAKLAARCGASATAAFGDLQSDAALLAAANEAYLVRPQQNDTALPVLAGAQNGENVTKAMQRLASARAPRLG